MERTTWRCARDRQKTKYNLFIIIRIDGIKPLRSNIARQKSADIRRARHGINDKLR